MEMSANDGLEFSLMQFDEEASRQSEDFHRNHPGTISNNSTGSPHPLLGHSVRDFEMQLTELRKENFNLKLRVYFLEEKNPNISEGEESLYKQNIDLKILNETLEKELQDKQQLCVEASKAMELLDEQQTKEIQKHSMVVEELHQKIESMNHEIGNLQKALSEHNKTPFGNDTGFADFVGALDTKDVENHQKMVELEVIEKKLNGQLSAMTETVFALKTEKNLLSTEIEELKFDNSSLKEQIDNFVKSKSDEDGELQTFKDLWAETKCDLDDCQTMLKEKESELEGAVKFIQKSVNHLAENRAKIEALEAELAGSGNGDMSSFRAKDINLEGLKAKDEEITKLKVELKQTTQNLQGLVNKELWEKNREIEKLNKMVNSLQAEKKTLETASLNSTQNQSFDVLAESYNDQRYQEALELKMKAQNEMKRLLKELYNSAGNVKTRDHIKKLEVELKVVVEQQEVTESTLNKCTELCALTMEQLHELAMFLSSLINQKDIQESLSDFTLKGVRSCVNKSLEMSKSLTTSRFSLTIGDTSLMQLGDLSNLDLLINNARDSLSNFRQVNVEANFLKPNQASNEFSRDFEQIREKLLCANQEVENFNRVNQMLEDEICQYKDQLEKLTKSVSVDFEQLKMLKEEKNRLSINLRVIEGKFEAQAVEMCELKVEKTQRQKEYIENLKTTKAAFESNILLNYIHKDEHASVRQKIDEELKIKEANIQGMLVEMEHMKEELMENEKNFKVVQNNLECLSTQLSDAASDYAQLTNENRSLMQQINELYEHKSLHGTKMEIGSPKKNDSAMSYKSEEKENLKSTIEKTQLKTLDISEDRKQILLSTTISNISTVSQYEQKGAHADCVTCQKNEAKIIELKQRLLSSYDKLRSQNEIKAEHERSIKKQILKTRNVLAHAHSNMEQIYRSRENPQ
ncbi:unnamed protein product [Diamesa serratosioi]